jgi:hypothetical protein
VPCCGECNFAKQGMPYDEWMSWIARLTNYQNRLQGIDPGQEEAAIESRERMVA